MDNHQWIHDNMTADTKTDGSLAEEWHLLHIAGTPHPEGEQGCQACIYVNEVTGRATLTMHGVYKGELVDADTAMNAAEGILRSRRS